MNAKVVCERGRILRNGGSQETRVLSCSKRQKRILSRMTAPRAPFLYRTSGCARLDTQNDGKSNGGFQRWLTTCVGYSGRQYLHSFFIERGVRVWTYGMT